MKPPDLRLRVLAWLLPLAIVPAPAQGQQYVKITAEIKLLAYRGEDTNGAANATPRIISVVCSTGKDAWRVEGDSSNGSKTKWFFDGTNVYQSLQVTEPMPKEEKEKIEKVSHFAIVPFERARSNITINVWPSSDGHPLGNETVNITWLAFCSGPYLKREGRLVPLPLEFSLHHTRDRFAYTDKTDTFRDDFGLPRVIDLFLSKALWVASETDFDKEYFFGDRYTEWIKKRAQTLTEGEHMFHYEATETTNYMGWTFPTRFTFSQNGRPFEQNGNWVWQGNGIVKSVGPGRRPEGLFDPKLQQTIVDWRFRDSAAKLNALTYTWTNNWLSESNNPVLQQKFADRVARMSEARRKQERAKAQE